MTQTRPFRACSILMIVLVVLLCLFVGCTSNHYFSINAEEMTNPKIEYHDSTNVQIPF